MVTEIENEHQLRVVHAATVESDPMLTGPATLVRPCEFIIEDAGSGVGVPNGGLDEVGTKKGKRSIPMVSFLI